MTAQALPSLNLTGMPVFVTRGNRGVYQVLWLVALDCVAGIKPLVFKKEGGGEGASAAMEWIPLAPTYKPKGGEGEFVQFSKEPAAPKKGEFGDVSLKASANSHYKVWAQDIGCIGTWVLPLKYIPGPHAKGQNRMLTVQCMGGLTREIPDSDWLIKIYPKKYSFGRDIVESKQ